jgi:hypothetical protein
MKNGQQVTEVGVLPLSQKNMMQGEARLFGAGFFVFLVLPRARTTL